MQKQVRVAIGEKVNVEIEALEEFQGDLKDLTVENYEKAKKSIQDLGFSFTPHVWKCKNKLYLIDGHQRVRTLKKMKEEGFKIPKIPIVIVQASGLKEAKKKVLAGTAQYGEMTNEGLYQFMSENDIGFDEVDDTFRFPELDMEKFEESFFTDPKEVSFTANGSREIGEGEFSTFQHQCPKCGFNFDEKK